MRKRLVGLVLTAGVLVGVGALPAAASGCPEVGEAWSAWAQLGPGGEDSTGAWTARVASSQTTEQEGPGYGDIDEGPGVISRVVSATCP